ncbi:unnamed protein product [Haemonchus placei]|uniref:ANF_receptor domain-containing protein n=1 Tax=Haemonchus placei TaxID=6290 RepID=A0A0N4WKA6_HAEPC|nr:unnamed protein product [Haemonchus placei]
MIQPQCQCNLSGTIYDFCYHLPPKPHVIGRRFDCANAAHLKYLGLLSAEYALHVKKDEFPEHVFVTAMSDNHFKEGLTLIANIRELWPQRKNLVYDLGLPPKYVKELQMTLKEFGAVWYMDTSIRRRKDRLDQVYDEIRCRRDHDWPEYDQSVINFLLANAYGYNAKNYVSCLGFEGAIVNRTASDS